MSISLIISIAIVVQISLKLVHIGSADNNSTVVHVMVWHQATSHYLKRR